jgi:hypothetical protein
MQASRIQAGFHVCSANFGDLAHSHLNVACSDQIPAHAEKIELEHLHLLLSMTFMEVKLQLSVAMPLRLVLLEGPSPHRGAKA